MSLRIDCLGILQAGRYETFVYIEGILSFHEAEHNSDEFVTWLDLIVKAYVNVTHSDLMNETSVRSQ